MDSLDDGSFAEKNLAGQGEQPIVHLLAEFGDELNALRDQQLLGERLRQVAFIFDEFAEEVRCQFGNRVAIIDIARCEAERE